MRVQRDGRSFTVDVVSDGEGLVSHVGSALLAQVAEKTGLRAPCRWGSWTSSNVDPGMTWVA